MPGYYATKRRQVFDVKERAEKLIQESFAEFAIAANLKHDNIVEHRYFKKQKLGNNFESHIVLDLMEGSDMSCYLKDNGPPKKID